MDDMHKVEISLDSAITSSERRESEVNTPASCGSRKSPSKRFDRSPSARDDDVQFPGIRGRVERIVDHHYCHMTVVGLVVLDVVFVLIELLIDLKLVYTDQQECVHSAHPETKAPESHGPSDHDHTSNHHDISHDVISSHHLKSAEADHHVEEVVAHVFHYLSMSVLCIFLIEYVLKLYVFRLSFFRHCMELFDLIVVIVSLILESVFHHSHSFAAGTGLLVILRLWRVTRIVNGIVFSVKMRARKKLEAEREERLKVDGKFQKLEKRAKTLERELNALSIALQKTLNGHQKATINQLVAQELQNVNGDR